MKLEICYHHLDGGSFSSVSEFLSKQAEVANALGENTEKSITQAAMKIRKAMMSHNSAEVNLKEAVSIWAAARLAAPKASGNVFLGHFAGLKASWKVFKEDQHVRQWRARVQDTDYELPPEFRGHIATKEMSKE